MEHHFRGGTWSGFNGGTYRTATCGTANQVCWHMRVRAASLYGCHRLRLYDLRGSKDDKFYKGNSSTVAYIRKEGIAACDGADDLSAERVMGHSGIADKW